jgi:hypothetical protein
MSLQDWLTAAIVSACAVHLAHAAWRTLRNRSGGACGCDKKCPASKDSLVQIERRA